MIANGSGLIGHRRGKAQIQEFALCEIVGRAAVSRIQFERIFACCRIQGECSVIRHNGLNAVFRRVGQDFNRNGNILSIRVRHDISTSRGRFQIFVSGFDSNRISQLVTGIHIAGFRTQIAVNDKTVVIVSDTSIVSTNSRGTVTGFLDVNAVEFYRRCIVCPVNSDVNVFRYRTAMPIADFDPVFIIDGLPFIQAVGIVVQFELIFISNRAVLIDRWRDRQDSIFVFQSHDTRIRIGDDSFNRIARSINQPGRQGIAIGIADGKRTARSRGSGNGMIMVTQCPTRLAALFNRTDTGFFQVKCIATAFGNDRRVIGGFYGCCIGIEEKTRFSGLRSCRIEWTGCGIRSESRRDFSARSFLIDDNERVRTGMIRITCRVCIGASRSGFGDLCRVHTRRDHGLNVFNTLFESLCRAGRRSRIENGLVENQPVVTADSRKTAIVELDKNSRTI